MSSTQIDQIESALRDLRARKLQSEQLLEQFNDQRRSLVVPARAGGSETAKTKLAEVEAQIAVQTRERDQDAAAISELERELEQTKQTHAADEKKASRLQLAESIEAAAVKMTGIAARVSELTKELSDAAELCESAVRLAGEVEGSENIIRFATATRGAIIYPLEELSKSKPNHGIVCALDRMKHFGAALTATAANIRRDA